MNEIYVSHRENESRELNEKMAENKQQTSITLLM